MTQLNIGKFCIPTIKSFKCFLCQMKKHQFYTIQFKNLCSKCIKAGLQTDHGGQPDAPYQQGSKAFQRLCGPRSRAPRECHLKRVYYCLTHKTSWWLTVIVGVRQLASPSAVVCLRKRCQQITTRQYGGREAHPCYQKVDVCCFIEALQHLDAHKPLKSITDILISYKVH